MKYVHDFPHHFGSLAKARTFCDGFFTKYNHVHHHSGIGWHTPASVHHGTYGQVDDARAVTLDRAWQQHPERFAQRPKPPTIRNNVWINQPAKEPTLTPTKTT